MTAEVIRFPPPALSLASDAPLDAVADALAATGNPHARRAAAWLRAQARALADDDGNGEREGAKSIWDRPELWR